MVFYCDTETFTLTTENYKSVELGNYKDFVTKRLEEGKDWVNEQIKKSKEENRVFPIMVVNALNTGISEYGESFFHYNPISFYKKIAFITKQNNEKTALIYYHNMKYDLTNILDYFDTMGAKYKIIGQLIKNTTWYQLKFMFGGICITIIDSFNLTHLPLFKFRKAFDLSEEDSKMEFDFSNGGLIQNNSINLSKQLIDYAINDVKCLKAGIEKFRQETHNSDKITIASTAFENWENVEKIELPELEIEEQVDANYTYTGAICYCNPLYTEKIIKKKLVYVDNNGLYSASSYSEKAGFTHYFPVSKGKKVLCKDGGIPDYNDRSKYYTIFAHIKAKLKKGGTIPFIRLGKQCSLGVMLSRHYKQNEYLTEFDETFFINSIDLRLLYKYYDVQEIRFIYYWFYETKLGIFDKYIDEWGRQKNIGKLEKNEAKKFVAKLMLNSLTGKFGQNIEAIETSFVKKENFVYGYEHKPTDRENSFVFMPIVSAILSYSREIFLDLTESYPKEDFFYCDTDSNIMTEEAYNKYIDKSKIDSVELGKWDIEYKPVKLKILRQKTYMFEEENGNLEIRCAGATKQIKEKFTFDNFELGKEIEGAYQLKPTMVLGGTALTEMPFKIRQPFR